MSYTKYIHILLKYVNINMHKWMRRSQDILVDTTEFKLQRINKQPPKIIWLHATPIDKTAFCWVLQLI
jgi:membrane-bound metal-dependent hydrolase YbcI (DUF457 family)